MNENIIAQLSSAWGFEAESALPKSGEEAVSAALWSLNVPHAAELTGVPAHDTHIISLCIGGRHRSTFWGDGRLRFDKDTGAGNLNIVFAGERPRVIQRCDVRLQYMHIYLPKRLLDSVAHSAEQPSKSLSLIDPCAKRDPAIKRIGYEILSEMRSPQALHRLRVDALGLDLAVQLIRRHSNLGQGILALHARGGLASWQLRRACEAMEAGLDADIGLSDLAKIAGCSPTHFSRAFKQSTGVAPFQWLNERRIERAKELLAGGRMPLAEIALAVGFSAQPQFTTAFCRATGITPGRWRKGSLL